MARKSRKKLTKNTNEVYSKLLDSSTSKSLKIIYLIILIFVCVALATSIFIYTQKISNSNLMNNFCDVLTRSNCETVQSTPYGLFLGIDLSLLGMLAFFALFVVYIWYLASKNKWATIGLYAGCTVSGIMGLWLVIVQVVILKMFCPFCLVVDGSSIILLIGAIFLFLHKRRENRSKTTGRTATSNKASKKRKRRTKK